MPTFQYETTNKTGKNVYVYSTRGESLAGVAQSISANGQGQPQFTYIPPGGMPPGQPVSIDQLDACMAQGGAIRGVITAGNGVSISAQFTTSELMLIPADGQRKTCDATLGYDAAGMVPGYMSGAAEPGYISDPYQQQQQQGYAMQPQPDPYATSPYSTPAYGYDQGYDQGYVQQQSGYDPNASYYGDPMMQQPQPELVDPRAAQGDDPMLGEQQLGEDVVKTGSWVLTLILLVIPVVNIISIIMALVGKKTEKSKKNFIKAVVIMWVVQIIIVGLMVVFFGSTITATLQNAGLIASNSSTATISNVVVDDDDEDEDEDDSITSSLSANTQSITTNNETTTSTENTAEETTSAAVRVTLDNYVVATVGEQQIMVVTATLINNTTSTLIPSNVLTFSATQGANELVLYTTSIEGTYSQSSQDVSVESGSQSGFKVAFILSNTTDTVNITVGDAYGDTLVTGQFTPTF